MSESNTQAAELAALRAARDQARAAALAEEPWSACLRQVLLQTADGEPTGVMAVPDRAAAAIWAERLAHDILDAGPSGVDLVLVRLFADLNDDYRHLAAVMGLALKALGGVTVPGLLDDLEAQGLAHHRPGIAHAARLAWEKRRNLAAAADS